VLRLRKGNERQPAKPYSDWRVVEMARSENGLTQPRQPGDVVASGYIHRTGQTFGRKHYEQFFFRDPKGRNGTDRFPVAAVRRLVDAWSTLIAEYQALYANAARAGRGGPASPHQDTHEAWEKPFRSDNKPTLCYARVDVWDEGVGILGLQPVQISRLQYPSTPAELVDETLLPAPSIERLSPADRVFGWTGERLERGVHAHRGQLRVGNATYTRGNGIEKGPGVLPILGQPKPSQARFYGGLVQQNGETAPYARGLHRDELGYHGEEHFEDGSFRKHGLRGRKVYPHHRAGPQQLAAAPGHLNRTVAEQIATATVFTFPCKFVNLSGVELGALLWLLSLGENRFHRLGYGRPLGFGSSCLTLNREGTTIERNEIVASKYLLEQAVEPVEGVPVDWKDLVKEFERDYQRWYSGTHIMAAFLGAAEGFDSGLPVRYPPPVNPGGNGYDWFGANEQGRKHSLPALWDATRGLPDDPAQP
jgi:CRISPR-associated protein (TIGR03986 family)